MGFKIDDIVHPDSKVIARQLECSVCLCIVDDPVQTACNHIFCASCVGQTLACPTCRTQFSPGDRRPLRECNIPLLRMLSAVQVWCPYRSCSANPVSSGSPPLDEYSDGDSEPCDYGDLRSPKRARLEAPAVLCAWTGSYGDLLAKHLGECPHHVVDCPRGCGANLARKDLAAHEDVCIKRLERCSICGDFVKPDAMRRHRKEKAEVHVQILEAQVQQLKAQQRIQEAEGENFVVWEIKDVAKMLSDLPKGRPTRSSIFSVGSRGPFHLKFYPNGVEGGPEGRSALYVNGPAGISAVFKCTVNGREAIFKQPHHFEHWAAGKGWPNVFPIPDAALPQVRITAELVSSFRHLGTVSGLRCVHRPVPEESLARFAALPGGSSSCARLAELPRRRSLRPAVLLRSSSASAATS